VDLVQEKRAAAEAASEGGAAHTREKIVAAAADRFEHGLLPPDLVAVAFVGHGNAAERLDLRPSAD
jgi:hypothetical protein